MRGVEAHAQHGQPLDPRVVRGPAEFRDDDGLGLVVELGHQGAKFVELAVEGSFRRVWMAVGMDAEDIEIWRGAALVEAPNVGDWNAAQATEEDADIRVGAFRGCIGGL